MRPVADSDVTASKRRLAAPTPSAAPAAAPATPAGEAAPTDPSSPLPPVAKKPMRPIGPAALKALRAAIQSGAYPSDAVVRDGIERLIRRGE